MLSDHNRITLEINIRKISRKSPNTCETKQDPVGFLGTKDFLCPPFIVGNRLQPP